MRKVGRLFILLQAVGVWISLIFCSIKVGCTPLHRAASVGNIELCDLIEGAEVDAVDRSGQTLLMHAIICENKQVALLLIRHGADVDVEDREGYAVVGRSSDDFRATLIDAAKAMLEG